MVELHSAVPTPSLPPQKKLAKKAILAISITIIMGGGAIFFFSSFRNLPIFLHLLTTYELNDIAPSAIDDSDLSLKKVIVADNQNASRCSRRLS